MSSSNSHPLWLAPGSSVRSSEIDTETDTDLDSLPENGFFTVSGATVTRAERLIERLFGDHCVCSWCFARRRIPYPDYDEARINAKDIAENSSAIRSLSSEFRRRDDGTLQVVSATSGPDPRSYTEVVQGKPKKEHPDDDRWSIPDGFVHNPRRTHPPRPKTICRDCAVIDVDPTDDRSTRQMIETMRNVLARLDEADIEISVHERAVVGMLKELREAPVMQGKDRFVLQRALAYGIHWAENAADDTDT